MNNYLMCGRLLKGIALSKITLIFLINCLLLFINVCFSATYIPPERQHSGFFSGVNWSKDEYPRMKNRTKVTLSRNRLQSAEDHERYVQRSLSKLSALESKLRNKGISIKFQPIDVPET